LRRKLGDRRRVRRYDIVGELGGAMEIALRLPVRNIGVGGALLESPVPLAAASVHYVMLSWNGGDVATEVRVCHVARAVAADGERNYLIGVEFASVAPVLTDQLARLMTASEGSASAEA
jgi:H2-forming N5,N10-methylenetetrahydromethanopterin dehydrogenase-like enzyme